MMLMIVGDGDYAMVWMEIMVVLVVVVNEKIEFGSDGNRRCIYWR